MPYDLTSLNNYFNDVSPKELALLLDEILYDLVRCDEAREQGGRFVDKYLHVMLLRNQFAKMDDNLKGLWKF